MVGSPNHRAVDQAGASPRRQTVSAAALASHVAVSASSNSLRLIGRTAALLCRDGARVRMLCKKHAGCRINTRKLSKLYM